MGARRTRGRVHALCELLHLLKLTYVAAKSLVFSALATHEAAMAFTIKVNGAQHSVDVDGDTPLLWVLRDTLGLTGTKFGCGIAQCGACTVFLNGKPLRSCALPVAALGDAEVTTIEGVTGRIAQAVQRAWAARDVPQCGYCQSGQVMSAIALLSEVRRPNDRDIDLAMNGNICRCATYVRIRAAIHDAARNLEG
jgi:isoquinoline 1-oxidoreductase subunit alpha